MNKKTSMNQNLEEGNYEDRDYKETVIIKYLKLKDQETNDVNFSNNLIRFTERLVPAPKVRFNEQVKMKLIIITDPPITRSRARIIDSSTFKQIETKLSESFQEKAKTFRTKKNINTQNKNLGINKNGKITKCQAYQVFNHKSKRTKITNIKPNTKPKEGKVKDCAYILDPRLVDLRGLDCEMVGIGRKGKISILARVSIVNYTGTVLYDTFVQPRKKERITDFRTQYSGVRPNDLINATTFSRAQKNVKKILKNKTVVGHALQNDFRVLRFKHPKDKIRDTALYFPFRQYCDGRTPSLKLLADKLLNKKIQQGEHSSIIDAQSALEIYLKSRQKWEQDLNDEKEKSIKRKQQEIINTTVKKFKQN